MMNKMVRSLCLTLGLLAVASAFTAVPAAVRSPLSTATIMPQEPAAVGPLSVMMVDMTGGALASVPAIGSIIMMILTVSLWEINGRFEK